MEHVCFPGGDHLSHRGHHTVSNLFQSQALRETQITVSPTSRSGGEVDYDSGRGAPLRLEIGRASCRERVYSSVADGRLEKTYPTRPEDRLKILQDQSHCQCTWHTDSNNARLLH